MKKPTLYLHIGTPRTGSSAIQTSLQINKAFLNSKGFLVRSLVPACDEHIAKLLKFHENSKFAQIDRERIFSDYMRVFIEGNYDNILISNESLSEFFCERGIDTIRTLEWIKIHFSDFLIKIICYLRRQDLYIESIYNHNCIRLNNYTSFYRFRNAFTTRILVNSESLDEYPLEIKENMIPFNYICINLFPYIRYDRFVSKLGEIFEKENIIIRPFEKQQLPNGPAFDFYSNVLGFSDNEILTLKPVGTVNEALDRDVLEFKQASGITDACLFECVDAILKNKNTNSRRFSNEERKRLMDYFGGGNSFIAREYLGRDDGRLFYDEIKNFAPYSGLGIEKATAIRKTIISLLKYSGEYRDASLRKKSISLFDNYNTYSENSELSTVGEIIESARSIYHSIRAEHDISIIRTDVRYLFDEYANSGKVVLIYGAYGRLAEQVLEIACLYERSLKIYVADRRLNGHDMFAFLNVNFHVTDLKTIKYLKPTTIIIASAFSGKDIKNELECLNMPQTTIYPAYDINDSIWDGCFRYEHAELLL